MRRQSLNEAKYILAVLGAIWLLTLLVFPLLSVFAAIAILFTLFFFRDPKRLPPADDNLAVSPADGVVVAVEECDGDGLIHGPVKRVVIFLSVFDVHINRTPIAGEITHSEAALGTYLDARNPLSSAKNARRTWVIRSADCEVVVRQITGAIARRIVAWRQVGDTLKRGQRFGMIRFGSRTEVDFPSHVEILIAVGQRVKGGETAIANIRGARTV
ncbi:MAG: phosphatidylserine decarboxylase [Terrimicrobiaceae bacterium]